METTEMNLEALDLNQQGVLLAKLGNIQMAVDKYQRAIDIDPMLIDSYKNLGDLYLRTEDYQQAKNYYKKALLIEKRGDLYFQYGNACFMNDESHEGLEYYNLALASGFDSDEMLFFMGMAYEHMNDDRMALRYFQKALIKNPSRPDYKVKKISTLLKLNMLEEAKKAVDELLLNDPELYDGYHMKIAILADEKKYEEAEKFAEMASGKFPEDGDLLYDYANVLALNNKFEKAFKVIENAKKMKYFENLKAKFTLLEAEIYAEQENIEYSIEKCKECIDMERNGEVFSATRFMLMNLSIYINDYPCALEQTEKIIEANNQDSYYCAALYFRPFCYFKMERGEADKYYNEAISMYRLLTIKNPDFFEAYLYRAMCLKDIKKYDEAVEILEFIENLNNEIAEIYTIKADVYKLMGNEALMKEALEKAYELKPELKEAFKEAGE